MIAEPLLDFFSLGGQYDTLPFNNARTLTILRHDVRTFVKHLDQAVRLCPFEVVRRERRMVFVHLIQDTRCPKFPLFGGPETRYNENVLEVISRPPVKHLPGSLIPVSETKE
jgi:hypothetical protein